MVTKKEILDIKLITCFIFAITQGLLGGLWNRFYNENLPYIALQIQMFVFFGANIFVSKICEHLKSRKVVFKIYPLLYAASLLSDLATVLCFQFMGSLVILLIGDTITFVISIVEDTTYVEMNSALLSGNERSQFSHRRNKVHSLGAFIAYGLSLVIGLLIIKNHNVSKTLMLVTQYCSWVTNFIILFPSIKVYNGSKPYVYKMWEKKEI